MTVPIRTALSGLGGYGGQYLRYLLDDEHCPAQLVAGADPMPDRCGRLDELKSRGISLYPSLQDLLEKTDVELVIIAAPHHYHADQTCLALSHGAHVLCEKPLGASLEEAQRMKSARDAAGKLVGIGYQWSYSQAMRDLKTDILNGVFGAPLQLKTYTLWPRDRAYYSRNSWAGSVATKDGRPVLDSPVNNATAHYLHNMLYVIGTAADRSARPLGVTAELYRANPIENYDTAMLRCETDAGVDVLFYTTHASQELKGPVFEYQFEQGVVTYGQKHLKAVMADGTERVYPSPDADGNAKVHLMAEAIRGNGTPVCGIETAFGQMLCMLAVQQVDVQDIASDLVVEERQQDRSRRWVRGLDDVMRRCYADGMLPSEAGVDWAARAVRIPVVGTLD